MSKRAKETKGLPLPEVVDEDRENNEKNVEFERFPDEPSTGDNSLHKEGPDMEEQSLMDHENKKELEQDEKRIEIEA